MSISDRDCVLPTSSRRVICSFGSRPPLDDEDSLDSHGDVCAAFVSFSPGSALPSTTPAPSLHEAREAEQARLTAIESEKSRKQEQARFNAAMNAKDPQTMYLAAGKYEREGDSYSARKVYEQIIDHLPSSPFAAKVNDQLLANQRSDRASSDLRDAQRQQGERAYQACREEVDACNTRTNYKGQCWRDCNSLR